MYIAYKDQSAFYLQGEDGVGDAVRVLTKIEGEGCVFYSHFTVGPSSVSYLLYVYFMNFDICAMLKSGIKNELTIVN